MMPYLLVEAKAQPPLAALQDVGSIVWDADPAVYNEARLLLNLADGRKVAGTSRDDERADLIAPHVTICDEAIHEWLEPKIKDLLPT